MQELEEKQTSSNGTSRPATSSRRRTHSESGICRFMMQSFQEHGHLEGKATFSCLADLKDADKYYSCFSAYLKQNVQSERKTQFLALLPCHVTVWISRIISKVME